MAERIGNAVVYMIVAVMGIIGGTGIPHTWEGWMGLVVTAITAFWGKFSSEQTLVAANRKPWPDEVRKIEAAKQ